MSGTTKTFCEKLLNAKTVRLAVVVSGVYSRAKFEWLKRLISAGKTKDQQHFQSLWAYFEREDIDLRQLALRVLRVGKEGPESYPKVPSYLIKSKEGDEALILHKMKLPPQYASMEQLVATYGIATSRAIQHEQLNYQSLIGAEHMCSWSYSGNEHSSVALLRFFVRLQTPILHRVLPHEGSRLTLKLSMVTKPSQGSDAYAQSQPLSVSGEIEATGLLKDGVNLILRCTLDHAIFSQLQDLARSGTMMSTRLSFSRSSSSLIDQLVALRRLLEYVPRPGSFDLKAQLFAQSPNAANTFAAEDFSNIAGKDSSLTPELLQAWYDSLSSSLDDSQQSPYWSSLRGLTHSYGHILGPPGTGKSRTAGSIIAAVAATKKVLVVAQTNDCLDDLLDKLLVLFRESPAEFGPIRRSITMCRYYSKSAKQLRPHLCVFKNPPEDSKEIKSDLHEYCFGDYGSTKCSDVALERLVHLSVVHAARTGLQQDDATTGMMRRYRDSYLGIQSQMAAPVQVRGMTEICKDSTADFDSAQKNMSEQLLARMNIVFATIDQCASLVGVFNPQLVILEESSQINLCQGIKPLVYGHRPEALLTIGDKMQLGPVVPSALDGFNEMADALTKPFIEHLEPLEATQCFPLGNNYRNPASIWAFPRGQYEKKGIEVESAVDVENISLLRRLRETAIKHGASFLRGVLDQFDLHKNQQVWFDTESCTRVPYAPIEDPSPDPNPLTIVTHENEHLEYKRRYRAAKVNYGG
ncbi:hypothetical protein KC352_g30585, partial [Hortaea werneckii]